jgi:hypothetical protein
MRQSRRATRCRPSREPLVVRRGCHRPGPGSARRGSARLGSGLGVGAGEPVTAWCSDGGEPSFAAGAGAAGSASQARLGLAPICRRCPASWAHAAIARRRAADARGRSSRRRRPPRRDGAGRAGGRRSRAAPGAVRFVGGVSERGLERLPRHSWTAIAGRQSDATGLRSGYVTASGGNGVARGETALGQSLSRR